MTSFQPGVCERLFLATGCGDQAVNGFIHNVSGSGVQALGDGDLSAHDQLIVN